MTLSLVRAIKEVFGGDVDYLAYNFADMIASYGVPPVPLNGLEYITASHLTTQNRMIMSLTGKGVFCSNLNNSGVIEIGLMAGCASAGAIQALSMTGVPLPIFCSDKKTYGTSFVLATACKPIRIPKWQRTKVPGITTFTFYTPRLMISQGVREVE